MKMQQKIVMVAVVILGLLGLVSLTQAASDSLLLSPAAKTVTKGQTFTVVVSVKPVGDKVYTVKASVTYPASLLEVKSFAFASGWLPLTQPGYDSINNTNGLLVKSAGYAGGLSSLKTLGTITFRAKAAGTARVLVGNDSLMLNATNVNLFSSGNQSVVTVLSGIAKSPTSSPVAVSPTPT